MEEGPRWYELVGYFALVSGIFWIGALIGGRGGQVIDWLLLGWPL